MMKKTTSILCSTLFVLIAWPFLVMGQDAPKPTSDLLDFPLGTMEVVTPHETHSFIIELALDRAHQAQGLMFRKHLPDDRGMLFMFPKDGMRSFWMRNTLIPLDLIFINASGRIVHIHRNAIPLDESPLPSKAPAKAVLEVRGGLAEDLDINIGDIIRNVKRITPVEQAPQVAQQPQNRSTSQTKPKRQVITKPVPKEEDTGFWSYWNAFTNWF